MKLRLILGLILTLLTVSSWGLPSAIEKAIHLTKAREFYDNILSSSSHNIRPKVAIHDVSFFGYKILLRDEPLESTPKEMGLISPHGSSVTQVFKGVDPKQSVSALTKGIYIEDFNKAIRSWEKHHIKLVNLSMSFRSPEIIHALNGFIERGGVVVASSGNSGARLGIDLAPHYQGFKGLTVSATDNQGRLTSFSQFDEGLSVLAPGERESYPTKRVTYKLAGREQPTALDDNYSLQSYAFGMTSASAPVVSGLVAMALTLDNKLSQKEINLLLKNSATLVSGKKFINAHAFFNQVMVFKHFKEFYHQHYRALMCSDNVIDFREHLLREESFNISLERTKVYHYRKVAAPMAPVTPALPRTPGERWTFHSFMVMGDLVLDFDFTDKPRLVTFEEYKKTMWSKSGKILSQNKPLLDYKKGDLGGSMVERTYPWTEI